MPGAVDQDAFGKWGILKESDIWTKQREFEVSRVALLGGYHEGKEGWRAAQSEGAVAWRRSGSVMAIQNVKLPGGNVGDAEGHYG